MVLYVNTYITYFGQIIGGIYMTPRIFWAGDSTVKQNDITSYPQTGIGQGFELYIKKDVQMINLAENGRSTKSFIDEGRLQTIDKDIREGDLLFIQFGHNDEKPDAERHTEAFGSYQTNLTRFARIANKHGAYPVFITPLYRRLFHEDGSMVANTHLDYPTAMLQLGETLGIPVIDLCSLSKELLETLGEDKSRPLFMHLEKEEYENYPDGKTDNTHLRYEGAVLFAGIIAKELRKLSKVYNQVLLPLHTEKEDAGLLVD